MRYEICRLGFYTQKRRRLVPSFHRYPCWSLRWLGVTVYLESFQKIGARR